MNTNSKSSPNALDGEIITIRRGLAIYKVNASPYYFARIRDSRNKRNIVRSTKETSRIAARKAAEELAQSIFNSGVTSEVPKQFRFQHFAELSLQDAKSDVRRGVRAKSFIKNTNFVLENKNWGLLNAFGDRDVRQLETRDFALYIRKLISENPELSSSTHNQIRIGFRKTMKMALLDGVINSIPDAPKLNVSKTNTRTFFRFYPLVSKEKDDYKKLLRVADQLAREETIVRGIPVTQELRDIILFIVHSFVRPTYSELYALKHADVTIADDPKRLMLTIRKGKTGYRVIDSMEASVTVYKRIRERNEGFLDKEDYLFLPQYKNRETAKRIVMRQFNVLLEKSGLKKDPYTGKTHSLYSLRHQCICMRLVLSEGKVNIYALARNSGNSVEILEKNYLRSLPNTNELARNLQSFGGGRKNEQ